MYIGDKVQIKEEYILKIAKKNFELAKYLVNKTGEIIKFDEITWYYIVKFDDKEFSFRRFHLKKVNKKG